MKGPSMVFRAKKFSIPLVIAAAAGLIMAMNQASPVPPPPGPDPIKSVFDEEKLESERRVWLARAEQMSDQELCAAIESFREQALEEARWGQFLDWTMWYIRDSPDGRAHERWKSTWSKACNDLFGQTDFLLQRIENACTDGKPAIHARIDYAFIAAALPQIREARLKISKGVLIDVYNLPPGSPRLGAWN